jgi:hypothetical protein
MMMRPGSVGRLGRLGLVAAAVRQSLGFSPALLFANNEQGAWYDPSDMSTLFQDAAGTVPVTAVEQPVGRMLDKSGRGNHATQSTAINRPVLSARVNLLTKTEDFDDSFWVKGAATVVSNSVAAPDGTATADTVIETAVSALHGVSSQTLAFISGVTYTSVIYAKNTNGGRGLVQLAFFGVGTGGGNPYANFDLVNGVVTASGLGNGSITAVGDGWYRCSLEFTCGFSRSERFNAQFVTSGTAAAFQSYLGDVTKGIYVWGADLRVANDGVGLPPYQYVNTPTDYDSGPDWPRYLRFDGIDDGMVTGTITPGTDKVQVFAGVRKLSDVGFAPFLELSAAISNGSFNLSAPGGANSATFGFASRGSTATAGIANSPTTFSAPITAVLCGIGSISEDISNLQINGIASGSGAADQGTGNYLSYPLYIGRRGGTSNPFNGRLYPLIVRFGPNLTTEQIAQTEAWVAGKTAVRLLVPTFDFITTDSGDQVVTDSGDEIVTDTYFV